MFFLLFNLPKSTLCFQLDLYSVSRLLKPLSSFDFSRVSYIFYIVYLVGSFGMLFIFACVCVHAMPMCMNIFESQRLMLVVIPQDLSSLSVIFN